MQHQSCGIVRYTFSVLTPVLITVQYAASEQ